MDIIQKIMEALGKSVFSQEKVDSFEEMIKATFKTSAEKSKRPVPANSITFQAYRIGVLHGQESQKKNVGGEIALLAGLVSDRAHKREKEEARKQADVVMSTGVKND